MGYFLNLRTYRSVKAFSTSYFSRKDIEVVAGSGCPSTDRKVVNSGKRLRAHVDIDEGNVCAEFLRYENNIQSFSSGKRCPDKLFAIYHF